MIPLNIIDLPIAEIDVPENRARDFNPESVSLIAASIAQQGLFHPIRVRRVGERYRLISGLYRLQAYVLNQQVSIAACVVDAISDDAARLEEVMENLGRQELIALDRCHHLYELKVVWERMYPQGTHGGDRKSDAIKIPSWDLDREIFGFSKAIAEKVGLSRTAISRAVKIWSDLTPDSRKRLIGTPWAAKQSELVLLSGESANRQAEVLDKLLALNARVSSVSDALGLLNNGALFDDVEQKFLTANKVFGKLADPVLDRLIAANEERIVASLKRQGRI